MTATTVALGSFEFQILTSLIRDPDNAYGTVIQRRIEAVTGRSFNIGAVHTALGRLESKGFVSSHWGEPTPERGGRRKRYYRIQRIGCEAVQHTQKIFALDKALGMQ